MSDKYDDRLKREIFENIVTHDDEECEFQWVRAQQEKTIRVDEKPGIFWEAKVNYFCKPRWKRGKRHALNFGFLVIAVKKDNLLLILKTKFEKQFRTEISDNLINITEGIKW